MVVSLSLSIRCATMQLAPATGRAGGLSSCKCKGPAHFGAQNKSSIGGVTQVEGEINKISQKRGAHCTAGVVDVASQDVHRWRIKYATSGGPRYPALTSLSSKNKFRNQF